jgi:hypothetical protein
MFLVYVKVDIIVHLRRPLKVMFTLWCKHAKNHQGKTKKRLIWLHRDGRSKGCEGVVPLKDVLVGNVSRWPVKMRRFLSFHAFQIT